MTTVHQDIVNRVREYGYVVSDDGKLVSNATVYDIQSIIPGSYSDTWVVVTNEGTSVGIHTHPMHKVGALGATVITFLPYRLVQPIIYAIANRDFRTGLSRLEDTLRILKVNTDLCEYDQTKGNRVFYKIYDSSLGLSWARERINREVVALEDGGDHLILKVVV